MTTPRTWAKNDLVTHDLLNAEVRDRFIGLDSSVGGFVGTPGSATDQALRGIYVAPWKANTFYYAGQYAISPSGDVISSKVAFTSGATYSATNWNLSTSYAPASGSTAYAPITGSATYETQTHAASTYQTSSGLDSASAALVNTGGSATRTATDALYALPTSPAAFNIPMRNSGNTGLVWTTSQAAVARALGWTVVTDSTYGADPTGGTDSTTAIQSSSVAAGVGGTLYFPANGVFVVSKQSGLDYMLEAKSGQRWTGPGTIRVSSTAGDYRSVIAGVAVGTDLSGLTIDGITFDMNNTGNPVTTPANLFAGFPRVCVYVANGVGITVKNCTFKDIDSVNTVSINGATVANVRVQDNTFTGVGTSATVHDHSTIYISADGMSVTGNVVMGVSGGKGATTAIETHGAGQVVANNRVRDFYTGMNITGVAANGSDGANVHDNIIRGVNIGIDLWSHSTGTGLRRANVHDNNILIDHDPWLRSTTNYPQGIVIDPSIDTDIEDLSIHDNHIFFKTSVATAQSGELQAAGIALWATSTTPVLRNVRVTGNHIHGAFSSGIRWQATGVRVRIEHNEIIDPGSSTDGTMASFYKSGITFGGTVTDMRVRGNRTFDTRGTHVIVQGIMTSFTAVTRGTQGDNPVICADGTVVAAFVQTAGQPFAVTADAPVAPRFSTAQYYGPEGGRSTAATANGTMTAVPFWVSQTNGFDRIGAQTTVAGVASTVVRLGIYADNGNGIPGALILDAGTIAGDAVASAEITISKTLAAGLYWLASVPQGGTPTMTCVSGSNTIGAGVGTLAVATGTSPRMGYTMTGVAGALPSTFTVAGQTAGPTLVVMRST